MLLTAPAAGLEPCLGCGEMVLVLDVGASLGSGLREREKALLLPHRVIY